MVDLLSNDNVTHHRNPAHTSKTTTTTATGNNNEVTDSLENETTDDEQQQLLRAMKVMADMKFLTSMAAIGGFLFGYDTGVISGAMLPLVRTFDLTPFQQEMVVSSTVFAALVASLVGGTLNDKLGRRICCLWASSIFTLGSLVLMISWDYPSLVAGRIIVGLGIGIASLTTPVYIAEMALPRMRGQLVTINALLVTVGQFTAGMVDGILDEALPDTGWRYMLGLAAVPALIMTWGFLQLPESPRWLAHKGRLGEATKILIQFRESDQDAQEEMLEIKNALPQELLDALLEEEEVEEMPEQDAADRDLTEVVASRSPGRFYSWSLTSGVFHFVTQVLEMLENKATRKALFLGCGLMWIQQLSGINTVMVRANKLISVLLYK